MKFTDGRMIGEIANEIYERFSLLVPGCAAKFIYYSVNDYIESISAAQVCPIWLSFHPENDKY